MPGAAMAAKRALQTQSSASVGSQVGPASRSCRAQAAVRPRRGGRSRSVISSTRAPAPAAIRAPATSIGGTRSLPSWGGHRATTPSMSWQGRRARSRAAWAKPTSSSIVTPFQRRAIRKAAIVTSDSAPAQIDEKAR